MQKIKSKEEMFDLITSKKEIVLKFETSSCPGCKRMDIKMNELTLPIDVAVVNVEDVMPPMNWGIRNVPSLLRFKEGNIMSSMIGEQSGNKIMEFFN